MINHASSDERVSEHPGLKIYGIESYIAVPLLRRDGSYFGTLCALDPLPAQLDETNFGIFELLSQLISFELEAEDEKIAREAQIGALNDLVSIAGHDLRQPLSALRLRAQMTARRAKREGVSPELAAQLDGLVTDTQRAILLTDSLLDVGRIQAGSFTLEEAEIDLAVLVQQVVEDVKTSSPNHSFQLETPHSLTVKGDGLKLGQVIRNLLDNAVKYSPESTQPIEVKLSPLPTSEALFQVRDYGIGVAESELSKLFQRQYRSSNALESGISGSGLGLYISQKIIEAHQGKLWAELADGGGMLFQATLPLISPS